MSKLVVYYSHSSHLYNSFQENRDIALLERLGFEVVNPNSPEHQIAIDAIKREYDESEASSRITTYLVGLINQCQVIAFRSLVEGSIPFGVWNDITFAKRRKMDFIELPNILERRALSLEDTRSILGYNGQR